MVNFLTPGITRSAAGGGETHALPVAPVRSEYPAGKPLSLDETNACRPFRPKAWRAGDFCVGAFLRTEDAATQRILVREENTRSLK